MDYSKKLEAIIKATGWSQERLARELETSFPSVNAWLNGRSNPRATAQKRIDSTFVKVLGGQEFNEKDLVEVQRSVQTLKFNLEELVSDQEALDTLTLHLTYHTNTIEGSTMTLTDVHDVIFDSKVLANRTLIEQIEAKNHQAAFYWLLDKVRKEGKNFAISEDFILQLHSRLMNGIITNAGEYRNHQVRIVGSYVPLANWRKIPDLMQKFVKELDSVSEASLLNQLAQSHAIFEKIHPFSDGNGRVGRLLLFAQTLSQNMTPPLVAKERKQAYYLYLQKAQNTENYNPLELFLGQSMQTCYELLKS